MTFYEIKYMDQVITTYQKVKLTEIEIKPK